MEPLLTPKQVAVIINNSTRTLQRWRMSPATAPGGGIPHLKIGTAVRYKPEDVKAWLDRHAGFHSTTQARIHNLRNTPSYMMDAVN